MSDFGDIVVNLYIGGDKGQRSSLASALSSYQGEVYTKAEANYRPEEEEGKECGTCVMYKSEGGAQGICMIVKGDINPDYVCDHFAGAEEEKPSPEPSAGKAFTNRQPKRKVTKVPNRAYYDGTLDA